MATFAEYPAQTMASHDFTLYPYPEVWNQDQAYLPPTSFPDQSYLTSTTFGSYPALPAYAPTEPFPFSIEHSLDSKTHLPPGSSSYSPTNSASHSFDPYNPPNLSDSGASVQSTISSAIGSPSVQPQHHHEWNPQPAFLPEIIQSDLLSQGVFGTTGFDLDSISATDKGCVDPSLIQPTFSPTQFTGSQFPEMQVVHSPQNMGFTQSTSPVATRSPIQSPQQQLAVTAASSASPYMSTQSFQPYPAHNGERRQSISSVHSQNSQRSSVVSEDSNKGLCRMPNCGRHVKDLKAHMLTHQNERPEKCPIPTCEYHQKGFARKYDKNRHTLTHYKGTMVCGFCPGSGSAAEKSFNRADVFKRHLTSVHGVEQTPPNARRKSPSTLAGKRAYGRDVSGMCSTCGVTFASAQDFYEHLDDCVLRVVQRADPSEAINVKLLSSVESDQEVLETLDKHRLETGVDLNAPTSFDDEEEGEDEEEVDEEEGADGTFGSRTGKSGKGGIKSKKNAVGSSS